MSAPAQSKPAVVCIDDDEDEVKEINTGLTSVHPHPTSDPRPGAGMSNVSAPLYMDVWQDHNQQQQQLRDNGAVPETDATPQHSLPGMSFTPTSSGHDLDAQTDHSFSTSLPVGSQAGALAAFSSGNVPVDGTIPETALNIQGWEVNVQPSTSADGLAPQLSAGQLLSGDAEKSSPQKVGFSSALPILR